VTRLPRSPSGLPSTSSAWRRRARSLHRQQPLYRISSPASACEARAVASASRSALRPIPSPAAATRIRIRVLTGNVAPIRVQAALSKLTCPQATPMSAAVSTRSTVTPGASSATANAACSSPLRAPTKATPPSVIGATHAARRDRRPRCATGRSSDDKPVAVTASPPNNGENRSSPVTASATAECNATATPAAGDSPAIASTATAEQVFARIDQAQTRGPQDNARSRGATGNLPAERFSSGLPGCVDVGQIEIHQSHTLTTGREGASNSKFPTPQLHADQLKTRGNWGFAELDYLVLEVRDVGAANRSGHRGSFQRDVSRRSKTRRSLAPLVPRSSGNNRTFPTTVMKLVSPFQRGTTCTCR
jgi:hypothetical protein